MNTKIVLWLLAGILLGFGACVVWFIWYFKDMFR